MNGIADGTVALEIRQKQKKGTKDMDRIAQALEYRKRGYTCSQAVACVFCDKMNLDEKTVFEIMEGFGIGGGDMRGTCGAVSGMAMVTGKALSSGNLDAPDSKQKTYAKLRELNAKFREKNGSTLCRELKGLDTGEVLRSCNGCVEDAVRILMEEFGE